MRQLTRLHLFVATLVVALSFGSACDDASEPVPAGPVPSGAPWQPLPQSPGPVAKACYGPLEAGEPLPPEPDPEPEVAEVAEVVEAVEDAASGDADAEALPDASDVEADGSVADSDATSDGDGATAEVDGTRDARGGGVDAEAGDIGPEVCPTCPGEDFPAYAAGDFQPQSCSYRRAYGLEAFKGRPTVAVLLAAW